MRAEFDVFVLDTDRRELTRAGGLVRLAPKAFQLLQILIECRPKAVSQQELYDRLWPDTFVEKSNLHNLIYQLRAALGDEDQTIIRTAYGFGFMFAAPAAQVSAVAPWQLIIDDREFGLRDGENIVGRDPGVAVRIESGSISRHHACIKVSPQRITIEDLGSKNGTSVGGRRLNAPCELHDGDRIMFGIVRAIARAIRPAMTTESIV
jgi:DNA-binding winged helix-turn-helix (wHTH) protein